MRAPAQTFNHVAMSVPAALLDAEGRASLLDFFGEVFGWTEMPTLTEDGHRLVLRAHSNEQFVFLIADDRADALPERRSLRALGAHARPSSTRSSSARASTASAIRASRSTRRRSRTTACSSSTASTSAIGCR